MPNPVSNLILNGRVYFGNALVAGYDIDHISIIETYKGLQELHLHGWHKSEEWEDELKVNYQLESESLDPIAQSEVVNRHVNTKTQILEVCGQPVVQNPLHVMVNILRLKEGAWNPATKDYDWRDLDRRVRFNGRIVQAHKDHLVLKPVEEGLTQAMLTEAMQALPRTPGKAPQIFVNPNILKGLGLMS